MFVLILGGKRVCNSLDGNSYKSRTAIAAVQFNSKGHSGSKFHEHTYGNTLDTCVNLENNRKRKVAKNAVYKEVIKSKKPKEDKKAANRKAKPKHYGDGHQDLDMMDSAYEIAKNRFLEKLLKNQSERQRLAVETKAQHNSFMWIQVRRNMLTSSYFGRILKTRNRKSYTKIIEEMIHRNIQYSNSAALRHQRLYQMEALTIFSNVYGPESISQCGIVIDPKICFLGNFVEHFVCWLFSIVMRNVFFVSVAHQQFIESFRFG